MKLKFCVRTVLFVLLTLFFVVYMAPADKVLSLVKLPPDIKLYHVSGDIWDGKISAVETNGLRIRNVDWRLTPLTLFFIKGANITVNDEALGKASLGIDLLNIEKRTSLSDVKFNSSLDKLYPFFKDQLPFPLSISGKLTGEFSDVAISNKGSLQTINGHVNGTEISVDHPFEPGNKIIIGEVELKVRGNASDLKINLEQNSEQFEFSGTIGLRNMSDLTIDGDLIPKGGMPESLQSLLPMLGKADANGKIKIHFTQKINN